MTHPACTGSELEFSVLSFIPHPISTSITPETSGQRLAVFAQLGQGVGGDSDPECPSKPCPSSPRTSCGRTQPWRCPWHSLQGHICCPAWGEGLLEGGMVLSQSTEKLISLF